MSFLLFVTKLPFIAFFSVCVSLSLGPLCLTVMLLQSSMFIIQQELLSDKPWCLNSSTVNRDNGEETKQIPAQVDHLTTQSKQHSSAQKD